MVSQVWPRACAQPAAPTRPAWRCPALGCGVHQAPRGTLLRLESGGLGRRRPGHPGDAPSGRESRQALLPHALEGAGWIAMAAGHRQAGKPCGRPQRPRADGGPSNRTVREQPGRGVPPARPGAGTPHAASSRPGRHSGFWRSMRPLAPHSGSRVIASRQDTTGCALSRPSTLGIWRRAEAEEPYAHRLSGSEPRLHRKLYNSTTKPSPTSTTPCNSTRT